MLEDQNLEYCAEIYIIEKTIEVVVTIGKEPQQLRIEALLNPYNGSYNTRAYRREFVKIQPVYGSQQPVETQIWIDYDLPWTNGNSADDALLQALGFLRERISDA